MLQSDTVFRAENWLSPEHSAPILSPDGNQVVSDGATLRSSILLILRSLLRTVLVMSAYATNIDRPLLLALREGGSWADVRRQLSDDGDFGKSRILVGVLDAWESSAK